MKFQVEISVSPGSEEYKIPMIQRRISQMPGVSGVDEI